MIFMVVMVVVVGVVVAVVVVVGIHSFSQENSTVGGGVSSTLVSSQNYLSQFNMIPEATELQTI